MAFPHDGVKFKSGKSGNLAGRSKGKSVSAILVELGGMKAHQVPEKLQALSDSQELTHNEVIALQLLYKAIFQGSIRAIKEIMDRTEGRTIQRTELSGFDGGTIPVRFMGIEVVQPAS